MFETLTKHYFNGEASIYDEDDLERRFRMLRSVFNRIQDKKLLGKDPFMEKADAHGKEGITPLVRLVAAIQQLGYGEARLVVKRVSCIGRPSLPFAVVVDFPFFEMARGRSRRREIQKSALERWELGWRLF